MRTKGHTNLLIHALVFVTLILFGATNITAAPGDLDLAFSGDGKLLDFMSRGDDSARGVAIQPDGKIVVAGSSLGDFAVARYNTDGSLDTSFGTDGKVTTDINSSYDGANAIAIQQDGKIVVAGVSGGGPQPDFALVRYNSDGSLDTSFGSNGKVTTDIDSGAEEAYSVAIYTDGKIVAGGRRSTYDSGGSNDFAVVRYNSDGSLDTTFDSDGKVTTDIPSVYDVAYSVALQTDGKIVAAGRSHNASTGRSNFTLVRYNVDGSLDTSFDGDGKVTTQVGSDFSEARSVAIQPDGKIVAAGAVGFGFGLVRYSSNGSPENVITVQIGSGRADSVAIQPDGKIVAAGYDGSNGSFAVVRLNANFSLDTTFGTNGRVTTLIGSYASSSGVAVQADGTIVAAGYSYSVGDSGDFAVARYNANGSLDTSFDGDGKVTTDFGFFQGNSLYDTAIQADGKVVAAGEVRGDFAVLRYNPDGSPDTTFGSGTGKVRTVLRSYGGARAVAIQTDGKIVVVGTSNDGDDNQCCFALARYNSDGSLDNTFGDGGRVITGSSLGYSGGASDVVIQPDGKIVAAGNSNEFNYPNGGFAVYRYNSNGSLDTSFDGDGRVITPIGSSIAFARTVRIQPDGKIVAAGFSIDGSYRDEFAVVRYNGDGSLDPTFDGDGIVTTQTSTQDTVSSSVIQPDGKIIVAGSRSINANETGFALIRYNGDGSLDTTFGAGGIVTTQVGLHSGAGAVALQSNGKIVASGSSSGIGNPGDFAVIRYNANGSLDTTFGGNGIRTADFDNSTDNAYGMALDDAGRAVVVGESDGRFALARFLLGDPTPTPSCPNPIDSADFFIRQQYRDFLVREPEPSCPPGQCGLDFYLPILNGCGDNVECMRYTRGALSANFFRSPEFSGKGAYVANLFNIVIGQRPKTVAELSDASKVERPHYTEFITDLATLSAPTDAETQLRKDQLAVTWLGRAEVQSILPNSLTNEQFVQKLEAIAGINLANESALAANLNNGSQTRAQVLRAIAESPEVTTKFYIQNFVTMEYFGYLRRDPEDCHASLDPANCGYIFHNSRFNTPGADPDLIENIIVRGFIESPEYRQRFAP